MAKLYLAIEKGANISQKYINIHKFIKKSLDKCFKLVYTDFLT